ncbi:MAG: hypothetical protein R2939_01120 [Kofleriaceae bacterium]
MTKRYLSLLAAPLILGACGATTRPPRPTRRAAPTRSSSRPRRRSARNSTAWGARNGNTALNHTFDGNPTTTQAAKDAWNTNDDPTTWANFTDEIANNLGILDSLDATCGNQLGAGASATADRYDLLAGALADDRLYVNSASGTCTQYFAVEVDALGVLVNDDCGGRAPGYDVIETTYSALAAGLFTGVDDTITADDATHSATTFPFLAAPTS